MSRHVSHGRFVWYDLMTTDPDGAKDFYTKVTGWGTAPWEGSPDETAGEPYVMWTAGENPVGGVARLPEEALAQGAPTHWLSYVTVPDAAAVVEKTKELGGSVVMDPTTMAGVGTFAILRDPQGVVFCPFTPEEGAGGEVSPTGVGHFSWHELYTADQEAAFEFYSEIFGWKKTEAMDMGEMGTYQMFGPGFDGEFTYGGMMNKPADMPAPPHWLYYIKVADIHKAAERVKENGGQVWNGPMEVPGGDMIAMCMDPQGGAFALHAVGGDSEG
ncbi:MAG: VOC family protein [Longimicrobiales bacterium]